MGAQSSRKVIESILEKFGLRKRVAGCDEPLATSQQSGVWPRPSIPPIDWNLTRGYLNSGSDVVSPPA